MRDRVCRTIGSSAATFGQVLIILFLTMNLAVAATDSEKDLKQKLLNVLVKFSEENGISIVQTVELLRSEFTFTKDVPKGGIGLIEGSTYVVTDPSEGNILIQGKKRIRLGEPEGISVVLTKDGSIIDRSNIRSTSPRDDSIPLKTIIFSEKKIYVVDWDTLTGRYFTRP